MQTLPGIYGYAWKYKHLFMNEIQLDTQKV